MTRLALIAALATSVLCGLYCCRRIYVCSSKQRLLLLFALSSALQAVFALAYTVLGLPLEIPYNVLEPVVASKPVSYVVLFSLVPILAMVCARLFDGLLKGRGLLGQRAEVPGEIVLGVSLLRFLASGPLMYSVGEILLRDSLVGSVVTFIKYSSVLIPFILGAGIVRDRVSVVIFAFSASVAGVLALSEGSRGLAVFPVIYFLAGVIYRLRWNQRIVMLAMIVPLLVPLLFLSGAVEMVRHDVRTKAAGFEERLRLMIGSFGQVGESDVYSTATLAFARLVNWSNFAIVSLSPEDVQYRRFEDFSREVWAVGGGSAFTGGGERYHELLVDEEVGFGVAARYGFKVTLGGTVPVPVIGDGWSQLGYKGLVLYGIILCVFFATAEAVIRRLFPGGGVLQLVVISVLGVIAYERTSTYGFVFCIRSGLITLVFWLILCRGGRMIVDFIRTGARR